MLSSEPGNVGRGDLYKRLERIHIFIDKFNCQ